MKWTLNQPMHCIAIIRFMGLSTVLFHEDMKHMSSSIILFRVWCNDSYLHVMCDCLLFT